MDSVHTNYYKQNQNDQWSNFQHGPSTSKNSTNTVHNSQIQITDNGQICSTNATKNEGDYSGQNTTSLLTSKVTQANTSDTHILLATALVYVFTSKGEKIIVRALLDSASQTTFVTSEILEKLNNQGYKQNIQIGSISNGHTTSDRGIDLFIGSNIQESFHVKVSCVVLDKITCNLPQTVIDVTRFKVPPGIQLADPRYYLPSKIDILIGADLYFELLLPGLIKLGKGLPVLQNSRLGYLIAGPAPTENYISNFNISLFNKLDTVEEIMSRFWQLEEVVNKKHLTPEEKRAEDIFMNTTIRLKDGGVNSEIEGKILVQELCDMLGSANIKLHKWCSNNNSLLVNIPEEKQQKIDININPENSNKILGLVWDPFLDILKILPPSIKMPNTFTKRKVLSFIAQLFDPLGLVGPIVVVAKIIMQEIWCCKCEWDEELPPQILVKWTDYTHDISKISQLSIPRWISTSNKISEIQLHGYADASLKAYGTCIYIKTIYTDSSITSYLLTSKSRVAPLKVISIAKLELCGALLLARLAQKLFYGPILVDELRKATSIIIKNIQHEHFFQEISQLSVNKTLKNSSLVPLYPFIDQNGLLRVGGRLKYLNLLQNRPKWSSNVANLKENTIVLIKEENLPPLKWPLARIIQIFPGKDQKVRVVQVKTQGGIFTRPITKLCPLPLGN
ncbi:hypothetical protein NQ317_002090 [Molorchus minor]|uniref:DUF5641 domain-containing protein n=1 Tax=Molorchus minor TaxID=1323400 RepID=A0ABQ9JNL3_9CUCU|nr:hypothetical protein NQ317_002090 [Molorchus minor]